MTQVVEQLQSGPAGTVFFDATCGMCSTAARRLERIIAPRGFAFVPMQAPGVAEQLKLGPDYEDWEIKLLTPQNEVLGGADALILIARHIWWAHPIWLASHLPGAMPLMRLAYRLVARHRRRISRVCHLRPDIAPDELHTDPSSRLWSVDLMVSLLLFATGFTAAVYMRSWQAMWTLVACVWLGFKWFMWRSQVGDFSNRKAAVGFFLGWAGTDPRPFVKGASNSSVDGKDWLRAVVNIICGAALVWLIARRFYPAHPLVAGWIGMIGGVMTLHFGLFLVLANIWRANGVDVEPIMDRPMLATSVADLWSRWNLAFRDFAWTVLFRPLLRAIGFIGATAVVFLASGLLHELLVSVPARAGYGLPTLYFLIQGAAVLFEKSAMGRRLRPAHRRLLTYAVLIGPLGILFHPAFVLRVYVPFLQVIGGVP